jgi:hypothetical protein
MCLLRQQRTRLFLHVDLRIRHTPRQREGNIEPTGLEFLLAPMWLRVSAWGTSSVLEWLWESPVQSTLA